MPQGKAAIVATAATGFAAAAATAPRLDVPLQAGGSEGEREREGKGVSMSMEELIAPVPHLQAEIRRTKSQMLLYYFLEKRNRLRSRAKRESHDFSF